MEPLLTQQALKGEKKALTMLKAQRQWLETRPEYVRYLQRKGKLRAALLRQATSAVQRFLELWEGGVDVREAAQVARAEFVILPTREDSRKIPKHLTPFGQPR